MWTRYFVFVALTLGSNVYAAIHDGGAQVVVGLDGRLDIADQFAPRSESVKFEPDQEPIDIFEKYPELLAAVKQLNEILNVYSRGVTFKGLVVSNGRDNYKYYLVDKFPDVPDCRIPRDNTGVPPELKVYHIGCTRGNVTLLLENSEIAFSKLNIWQQAAALEHEGLRRIEKRIATLSIETIVRGTLLAQTIYLRQQAGDHSNISDQELAVLRDLIEEIPRTNLTDAYGRGGYSDKEWKLSPHGGVLVNNVKLDPSAFVSAGSVVRAGYRNESLSIGQNSQIIGSIVSVDDGQIEDNVILNEAYVHSDRLKIETENRLDHTNLNVDHDITLHSHSRFLNTKIRANNLQIQPQVTIENSSLFETWVQPDVVIGYEVLIRDSVVRSPIRDILTSDKGEATRSFKMGYGAKLLNSQIDMSTSFNEGYDAFVINLKLRARPLVLDYRGAGRVDPDISIADKASVRGSEQPLVLMSQYSMWGAGKIEFSGKLDLTRKKLCPMGVDASTDKETGIVVSSLKLTSIDQLGKCQESEPIEKLRCSHLSGCYGYDTKDFFQK